MYTRKDMEEEMEKRSFDAIVESVYCQDTQLYDIPITYEIPIKLPKNTVIAGGYAVNLVNHPKRRDNEIVYNVDLDIFIYGEEDYYSRIYEILDQFPNKQDYIRTANYIEFQVYTHPPNCKDTAPIGITRTYQIILNRYRDIYHLLNSFDLYASQVALDGTKVWMTRRGRLAWENKMNIFDVSKANTCYMHRLRKYEDDKHYYPVYPNGNIDESSLWEMSNMNNMSMYNSEASSWRDDVRVFKQNVSYALGKSDSFVIRESEKPLEYGDLLDHTRYHNDWALVAKKESSWLDRLGGSFAEIIETFENLKPILPPIIIHNDLHRLCRLRVDERHFYDDYQPLWRPEIHHLAPIDYLYVSKGISDIDNSLNDFKKEVMKYMSIARYKERVFSPPPSPSPVPIPSSVLIPSKMYKWEESSDSDVDF